MPACKGCRLCPAINFDILDFFSVLFFSFEFNTARAFLCVRVCMCVQYGTALPNMAAAESLFISKTELHSYSRAIVRMNSGIRNFERGSAASLANPMEMRRGVCGFVVAVPSKLLKDKVMAKLKSKTLDELKGLSCSLKHPLGLLPTKLVDAETVPICLCRCISVMNLPGGWELVVQAPGGLRVNIGWGNVSDVAWDDLNHKEVSTAACRLQTSVCVMITEGINSFLQDTC